MPGKHYKGVLNKNFDFKSEKPKNKKNYNKLTTSQAEKISEQVTMSAIKGGMPKGIGNYKGSGNFAMKNKMLSDSAKNGIPMQKNYNGMPNKPLVAQAKSQIVDSKVSGKKQIANLEKHRPKNSETNKDYQRALNLAKQRAESESNES